MFKVDDYVVYGLAGVYRVMDVSREQDIGDNETEYYVLQPAFDRNIIIKAPMYNSKVAMRRIITKDEALSLIATMPKIESVWIDDNRQRNETFRSALKSGDSVELLKVVKAVYREKKIKAAVGKKVRKTDEDVMKIAEKQLHEEFALALNIAPDEVVPYISKHIS